MINPLEEQVPETTVGTDEIDYKFGDTIETDENPTLAESSGTIIAEIQPALYGAFTKILSFLAQGTSSQDIVFIKDGKLNTRKSSGIIFSDMSDLFGDKSIEFIDPNNVVKLMSLIKGGEKISFINNNGQEYIISTIKDNKPDRIITLPIPDIAPTDVIEKPELNNCIFEMEVPVERIEDLVSAYKITEASYYIVDLDENNNIVNIRIENKSLKRSYEDKFSDAKKVKSFKLFDLMLVAKPDIFKIKIYEENGEYWFETISDLDLVQISYFEKVDELNDFDAFSL